MLSCSSLDHPAPCTVGCSYIRLCPSTQMLPAWRGASIPTGTAWSRPSTPVQDLAYCCWFLAEKQKRLTVPGCLHRQHPAPRLVQPGIPGLWVCRAGPLPRRLSPSLPHRAFTGKQPQFLKGHSPNLTLHLQLPYCANSLFYTQNPSVLQPPT